MPGKKATSVPRQYLLCLSTSYEMIGALPTRGVNNLSGAETVFAQLLDQRGAPDAQQARRAGDGAVSFLESLADETDFDRRHMVFQIYAAARQLRIHHFVHHRVGFSFLHG